MLERHADLIREIGLGLSRRGRNRPGYYVYAELVHGEPLGVPQTRRRLLFVGVRRDLVHPSACERLPRLLFPVACPHSRPTTVGSSERRFRRGLLLPPRKSSAIWRAHRRPTGPERAGPSRIVETGGVVRAGSSAKCGLCSRSTSTAESWAWQTRLHWKSTSITRRLRISPTWLGNSGFFARLQRARQKHESIGVAAGGFDASSASSFPSSSPRKYRNACFSRTSGRCSR